MSPSRKFDLFRKLQIPAAPFDALPPIMLATRSVGTYANGQRTAAVEQCCLPARRAREERIPDAPVSLNCEVAPRHRSTSLRTAQAPGGMLRDNRSKIE